MIQPSELSYLTDTSYILQQETTIAGQIVEWASIIGVSIAPSIPIVGSAIMVIDKLVRVCWEKYKEMTL